VSSLTSVEDYTIVLNIGAKLNVGSNGLPDENAQNAELFHALDENFIPNANSWELSTTAPTEIWEFCRYQNTLTGNKGCAPAIYSLTKPDGNAAAAASFTSPKTGMTLTITTDAPAVQFSTYQADTPNTIYGKGGWITQVFVKVSCRS
jgi:galactose mutarotase-like enzyme